MLALLGYLRDSKTITNNTGAQYQSSSTTSRTSSAASVDDGQSYAGAVRPDNSTAQPLARASASNNNISGTPTVLSQVKLQSITFARWQKHGDANPITYRKLDPRDVEEMRYRLHNLIDYSIA